MGDVSGAVLVRDVDAIFAELDHEGESAKLDLVVLVDEADEPLLGFLPSSLAEEALTGAGGGGRGVQGGLRGLAVAADFMFRLFVGGVDVVAALHFLFFVVASELALGLNMRWRLGLGSLGLSWGGTFRRSALGIVGQRSCGGGLFFIVAADLFSQVVVELFEALVLGRDRLEVDAGEELVLGAEVLNVLSGECDAVRELALVLLLCLVEKVRDVLLHVGELPVGQLRRQGVWRAFELNHMESVFKVKND